jgi:hypothetical protein
MEGYDLYFRVVALHREGSARALAFPRRGTATMQTSNAAAITPKRRKTLYREATTLLRQQGFAANGQPLHEARIARMSEPLASHTLKWLPPKKH